MHVLKESRRSCSITDFACRKFLISFLPSDIAFSVGLWYPQNGTSRYQIASQAIRVGAARNACIAVKASALVHQYEYILVDHRRYILENGVDPEEITQWRWH